MTGVVVTGVGGRMGSTILRLALEDKALEVVAAVEAAGHPLVGKSAEGIAGVSGTRIVVQDNLEMALDKADVVIDFTAPKASIDHFRKVRAKEKGNRHRFHRLFGTVN
jgi:4-hydroxy-tetrahydrodipicolinate reductase